MRKSRKNELDKKKDEELQIIELNDKTDAELNKESAQVSYKAKTNDSKVVLTFN
jgi:hypothetical protein